jgi:hypothetical protein
MCCQCNILGTGTTGGRDPILVSDKEGYFCYDCGNHVRWVPCHHGMARPQVVDGGDTLQFWRVAANIPNKQLRTADKG